MQEATARNPSWFRAVLALIVAPAVPALPLFGFPPAAVIFAIMSYGVAWPFFAPMYFLLRRHFTMTIGMCLAAGVGAALMASLVATASADAIDIYLSAYSAGAKNAVAAFLTMAKVLITLSAVTSIAFWLIAKPARKDAAVAPSSPAPASASSAFGRSRALLALVLLYFCLPPGVYWWTVHRYLAAEAADDGIVELYDRDKEASPNPIVIQVPPRFRYQSRDGRTGRWKDYKHQETSLRTFYPSFSSPRDPVNVARGFQHGCIGYCEGEINITIGNIKLPLGTGKSSNYAEVVAGRRASWPGGMQPAAAQFGFAQAFDETFASNGRQTGKRIFLMSSNDAARYSLVAECSMQTPNHICSLFFSLACNPDIGIEVGSWYYEHLDEALEIHRRVDAFVSSMVKEPKCGT